MTSKNEGPGKDSSRSADTPGQKRPHATLDLKATEVKTESVPQPDTTAKAASEPAKPATTATGTGAPAQAANPQSSADVSSASKTAQTPKSGTAASSPALKPQTPADTSRKPLNLGRFATHLVSGIAGGATALYLLHWLPEGNALKPFSPVAEKVRLLETKLSALEEATSSEPDPELAKKLDEASSRLRKLEEAAANAAKLSESIAKVEADTKALAEKVAQDSAGGTGAAERLTKLEDKLGLLSAAAGTEAEKGLVPQLAAITGRIADLENNVAAQIANIRKAVPEEVGTRMSQVAEASEAARTGTQRIDRELQAQKTESARINQRLEALKADSDRLTAAVDILKQEQGRQSSNLDVLKTNLDGQLKLLARPADIASAVTPLASKVGTIEKSLEAVIKNEEDRRADAERIVIALELSNLKRALDRGKGFSAELAQVRKVAGDRINLSALDRYQAEGVPTMADLERTFHDNINRVLDAENEAENAGFVDRIFASAKSVVRVRRVSHDATDKSTEALISRAEAALKGGQLGEAIAEVKAIPPKAGALLFDWLAKAEARHSVDQAIATVEAELKSSLGAASAAMPTPVQPAAPTQ
jgi:hypothetical protein